VPFDVVFNIINEFSRERCPCLIKKVLEDHEINGLDANTVLLSKNGDEIPIEDSIAPILDSYGNITGAVLVFRDCSDKRQDHIREVLKAKKYH